MATTTATVRPTVARYDYKIPFVIGASAIGTVIEWYDFYLYGVLAAFFSTQFFPQGNATAALLASLATFGAGFAVRPFGAAVFGRIGDIIGRKFTFLVTITVIVTRNVNLRPMMSPIRPKTAAPNGRTAKPAPNAASEARSAAVSFPFGKNCVEKNAASTP